MSFDRRLYRALHNRFYLMRILHDGGMPIRTFSEIFSSLIVNKITYCTFIWEIILPSSKLWKNRCSSSTFIVISYDFFMECWTEGANALGCLKVYVVQVPLIACFGSSDCQLRKRGLTVSVTSLSV